MYNLDRTAERHRHNAWAQENQTGPAAPTRRAMYELGLQAQHTEQSFGCTDPATKVSSATRRALHEETKRPKLSRAVGRDIPSTPPPPHPPPLPPKDDPSTSMSVSSGNQTLRSSTLKSFGRSVARKLSFASKEEQPVEKDPSSSTLSVSEASGEFLLSTSQNTIDPVRQRKPKQLQHVMSKGVQSNPFKLESFDRDNQVRQVVSRQDLEQIGPLSRLASGKHEEAQEHLKLDSSPLASAFNGRFTTVVRPSYHHMEPSRIPSQQALLVGASVGPVHKSSTRLPLASATLHQTQSMLSAVTDPADRSIASTADASRQLPRVKKTGSPIQHYHDQSLTATRHLSPSPSSFTPGLGGAGVWEHDPRVGVSIPPYDSTPGTVPSDIGVRVCLDPVPSADQSALLLPASTLITMSRSDLLAAINEAVTGAIEQTSQNISDTQVAHQKSTNERLDKTTRAVNHLGSRLRQVEMQQVEIKRITASIAASTQETSERLETVYEAIEEAEANLEESISELTSVIKERETPILRCPNASAVSSSGSISPLPYVVPPRPPTLTGRVASIANAFESATIGVDGHSVRFFSAPVANLSRQVSFSSPMSARQSTDEERTTEGRKETE